MTPISINLPDELAKASEEIAQALHISRTHFIRQAIAHEINNYLRHQEQQGLAQAFAAMSKNKGYLAESAELDHNLRGSLPDEEDHWWKKK